MKKCPTKRIGLISGSILLSVVLLLPQDLAPGQLALAEQTPPYTISLEVNLVVLDVTVKDPRGHLVSILNQENFEVHEDGHPQKINFFYRGDVPVTVGLVVDSSWSMRPKRTEVIAAALTFVQSSNPQDEVFVVNFNEQVNFGLGMDDLFTSDIDRLRHALVRTVCTGQTALYDAIALALDHLKKGNYQKKALLVISDGGDNASRHKKFDELLTMAVESNATLYTIGIYDSENKDRNPKVLRRLAKMTGGEFFSTSSVIDLEKACQRIARNIRNQYTLGYKPSNDKRDGKFRAIQVLVSAPHHKKLVARTREGYFAASISGSE